MDSKVIERVKAEVEQSLESLDEAGLVGLGAIMNAAAALGGLANLDREGLEGQLAELRTRSEELAKLASVVAGDTGVLRTAYDRVSAIVAQAIKSLEGGADTPSPEPDQVS